MTHAAVTQPADGWCALCQEFWQLLADQRVDLGTKLSGCGLRRLSPAPAIGLAERRCCPWHSEALIQAAAVQQDQHHIEQDRSRHAACKLNTALHLLAGKNVYVPGPAFPAFNPSRLARTLQMVNGALSLPRLIAPGRTIVSGPSLAYMSGELEYSRENVFRRAIRLLSRKQPFFSVSGDPAASLASEIGCDADVVPRLRLSSQCVVIVMAKRRGVPAVFRVGDCEEARAEVSRQMNGIRLAASLRSLKHLAPQQLAHSSSAARPEVSVESLLPGSNLLFSWKRIDTVLELWLASGPTAARSARPSLEQELTQVCDTLTTQKSALTRLKESLLEWHSTTRMPGAVVHGDLWLGNVLFSGDSVSGIVDWEWAHRDGLRVVDALHLLFMSHSEFRKTSIAETLRSFWSDAVEDAQLNARLTGLSKTLRLDKDDLKFAALLLWFDYLRQRILRGRMPNREWSEDMLLRTVPVIGHWLGKYGRGRSEATAGPRTERLALSRL